MAKKKESTIEISEAQQAYDVQKIIFDKSQNDYDIAKENFKKAKSYWSDQKDLLDEKQLKIKNENDELARKRDSNRGEETISV